jgi:drug/metabolite transporter (DMT)-like permease
VTPVLALLLVSVLWGGTFVAIKEGLDDAAPLLFVGLRFLAAALVSLPLLRRHPDLGMALRIGVPLGIVMGAAYAVQTLGLVHTTPARSAFLTGLNASLVPAWGLLLFRHRAPRGALLGLAVAMPGLWLLTAPGAPSFRAGEAWTILCAILFALHVVLLNRWGPEADVAALLVVQLATTAVLCLALAPVAGGLRLDVTPRLAVALLATAILATAGTNWLQIRYQPRLDPSRAGMIYATEPAFAALFALAWGESIGTLAWIGGGLIMAGAAVSEWDARGR